MRKVKDQESDGRSGSVLVFEDYRQDQQIGANRGILEEPIADRKDAWLLSENGFRPARRLGHRRCYWF